MQTRLGRLFHHLVQPPLYPLRLDPQLLHALEKQLVALNLARALDAEDEVVAYPPQLHLVLELWMPQALPADGVVHGLVDDGLVLALVPTQLGVRSGLVVGDFVETDDALGEAAREFLCVGADDGLQDVDGRHEAVTRRRDRGELCVVLANALHGVHGQCDSLARAHLHDQNVWVRCADGLRGIEHFRLLAQGCPDKVLCVHRVVDVQLVRVCLAGYCALQAAFLPGALDVQVQDCAVEVRGAAGALVVVGRLDVPLHPLQALGVAAEGNQAQAVGEHFVLDYRRVLVDEDVFDGEGGDLGEQDAAEGVCDRRVYAGEREGGVVGSGAGVEVDIEVLVLSVCVLEPRSWNGQSCLLEVIQVPLVVLAGPVSGEIGRLLVLHDFSADMELLHGLLGTADYMVVVADMPCAQPARQSLGEPCCCVLRREFEELGAGSSELF